MKLCRLWIRKYLGVIEIFAYNKDISQYSALHQSGECRPVLPGWSQSGCWAAGPMAAQHRITWTTSTANQSQPPLLIVFSMQHMECSHSSTNPRACSATWCWFWPTAAKYFCISIFSPATPSHPCHPWARHNKSALLCLLVISWKSLSCPFLAWSRDHDR